MPSLPLASIGSDKVQQSLSPGTLVPIAEHIGLITTQATEFNKQSSDCIKMLIMINQ